MKYRYAYRDTDGVRREAWIDAPGRDVAFSVLRSRGIRPIKVVAADGSKENGAERGGRRWAAAAVAAGAAVAIGVAAYVAVLNDTRKSVSPDWETHTTRRQLIGDSAVIDKGIVTGWSDVFPEEGERFFASFAIPGVKAGQRNTTVEELQAALSRHIGFSESDGMEARQIKAMVEGMKAEARAYIAAGGDIVEYGRRLTERQDAEIAIYERIKAEIDKARETLSQDDFIALWEEMNDQLRNLGIKLVPLE